MRFYHVADTHLGAAPDAGYPWSEERKSELWESLRGVIRKAEAESIDLLLIAGDLFHRQPLARELKEVNYLFSTLTKTEVVFIIGNHDYLKPDSYYNGFPWNKNVHCLDQSSCQKLYFPELKTSVYGLSYHSREITEGLYDNLKPDGGQGCSILLAHGGDEKHIPINKRKLALSGFDYIALGHIHRPQVLEEHKMCYAGALEPLDKNDTGAHGFIAGSYEKGILKTTFVPWAAREYIHLNIAVTPALTDFSLKEKIEHEIQEKGRQNIYKITATGFRDPDILFSMEEYQDLGNIVETVDRTRPSYDFEALMRQHGDDIVARYIRRLYREQMNEIERQALYLGIQALLETKG